MRCSACLYLSVCEGAMQKIWRIRESEIALMDELAAALGTSGLFAQLLISRGIRCAPEARAFLAAEMSDLHDPFLMSGMHTAVERLRSAIAKKDPIFIATDFDVDGVTSCAILEPVLRGLGGIVRHYVPHRLKNGYGLNEEAVCLAGEFGAKVFISLDCGITAVEEVAGLRKLGIDVIIVDHHEPPAEKIPDAYAILDPKQKTCGYPFKDLASVGLVFKLAQALEIPSVFDYIELVALGTVADVAPLKGENRIFVKHGLDALNKTNHRGLRALMEVAGIKGKKISTRSISFVLAPRLNASGRMDSAAASLELLLAKDASGADELARGLNEHNRQRQRVEEQVLSEAMNLIEREVNFKEDFIIVLAQEDWHPGVLGIVASKIADRFYRPAIVISLKDEWGRGSARSVHHFHIYEALVQCEEFLKEYGGHRCAAGLTIARRNIRGFKERLNAFAREKFRRDFAGPVLDVDAQIPLGLINENLLDAVDGLSPFGEGNPKPVFATRGLVVKSKPVLMGRNSLKFWVSDGDLTYEAVGFGMGDFFDIAAPGQRLDVAYSLGRDDWEQHNPIKLEIKDLKIS